MTSRKKDSDKKKASVGSAGGGARNGTYRRVMSRRTLLRGAGTVAIGLPFLSAMQRDSAYAALPEPPARAFNVFFGLGFPTPLQREGYEGPMEPLGALRDKLAIVRGVDQVRADIGGINAHFDGSGSSFAATAPVSQRQPGGATL